MTVQPCLPFPGWSTDAPTAEKSSTTTTKMTVEVILTPLEMEMAALVGIRRRIDARFKGRRDKYGLEARNARWDLDIEGAGAELAYAKAVNELWTPSIEYTGKRADHGETIHISWSSIPTACLIVRHDDPIEHDYVLVTGRMPRMTVVGWTTGERAMRTENLRSMGTRRPPAFFVPQKDLYCGTVS